MKRAARSRVNAYRCIKIIFICLSLYAVFASNRNKPLGIDIEINPVFETTADIDENKFSALKIQKTRERASPSNNNNTYYATYAVGKSGVYK